MQTPTRQTPASQPDQGPTNTPFKFKLTQQLLVSVSAEQGECIARSEHAAAEPQYLLRYRAADGRAVEAWWTEGALAAVAQVSTADVGGQTIAFLSGDAQPLKLEPGDRRFWVEHPSRNAVRAPSCADCKYKLVLKNRPQFWFCNHPTTPVDAMTGEPNMVCESARGSAPHKLCGVAGRLFDPLDKP